jgi:hypothetical protein
MDRGRFEGRIGGSLEEILCSTAQGVLSVRRRGALMALRCGSRGGLKPVAEVGPLRIQHAIDQRLAAVVGAAGGVVAAVSTDVCRLVAPWASLLAPEVE